MPEKSFSTLVAGNECRDRWYPQSVDRYQWAFKLDNSVPNCNALRKNLAYSMQYLEFLEKEFNELVLSSVLYTMLVKAYIIAGMSVLEGLFSNIIKSNGWWTKTNLESIESFQTNGKGFNGDIVVVRTELFKRVPDRFDRMDLDAMIQSLSHHHEALNVNHLVYPALKRLKNLRNRVHLQKIESNYDHDYNAFNYTEKKEMGSILYEILTSNMVTDNPSMFEFLKCNIDEDKAVEAQDT